MRSRATGVLLVLLLGACRHGPPPKTVEAPSDPALALALSSWPAPVTARLGLDPAWYFASDGEETAEARFEVAGRAARVQLERIGNVSSILCKYSKLRVKFTGDVSRTLYLVTHCNDGEASGDRLHGEYLAYVLRDALQLPGLRAQLLRLHYGPDQTPKPALLVEDAAARARTFGEKVVLQAPGDEGPARSVHHLDGPSVAAFHLFQILIGNRDWKLFQLRPLERWFFASETPGEVHNVFIVHREGEPGLPLPVDFDLTAFATLAPSMVEPTGGDEAELVAKLASDQLLPGAPPAERWMALSLLHFLRSHGEASRVSALSRLTALLPEATAALARSPVSAAAISRTTARLAVFERALGILEQARILRVETELRAAPEAEQASCALPPRTAVRVVERRSGWVSVQVLEKRALEQGLTRELCGDSGWVREENLD